MNFQCDDCDGVLHDEISYSASIEPMDSTFSIGDTLRLSAEFDAEFQLRYSGDNYNNTGQGIDFAITVFELQSNNQNAIQGHPKFEYFSNQNGVWLPGESSYDIIVSDTCSDVSCGFDLEFVCQSRGYFGLALGLAWVVSNDECEQIAVKPDAIGSGQNNFELAQEIGTSRFVLGNDNILDAEDIKRFYFFKVE